MGVSIMFRVDIGAGSEDAEMERSLEDVSRRDAASGWKVIQGGRAEETTHIQQVRFIRNTFPSTLGFVRFHSYQSYPTISQTLTETLSSFQLSLIYNNGQQQIYQHPQIFYRRFIPIHFPSSLLAGRHCVR